MIPLQLTLTNFLSYREATLDFRGLHIACICGANGAGKSSLLEAIAWSLWGESRALTEDDIIHMGAIEAQVDFVFQCHQQTFRVIRSRYRGQTSSLEFQVQTANGFRSLTGRGVRATQQIILQHLKLDYETFVNSAYLRQGRADEFMLKRPGERKQILADLLKLDQYDDLAEQAKERSRQVKAEVSVLERSIDHATEQLKQEVALLAEQQQLTDILAQMQQQQEADSEALRQLQAIQHQRQTWQQQLSLQHQQHQHILQDCQRLQQELVSLQQQQQTLEAILAEGEAIAAGYTHYQQLQAEDERQTDKFHANQAAQAQRQTFQQQQAEVVSSLKDQLRQAQAQLDALLQQEQELLHVLSKTKDVETALEQLRRAKTHLTELDQLQVKVAPLLQRRQRVQTLFDLAQARLSAHLDELDTTTHQLRQQQHRLPELQRSFLEITEQVEQLEKRRIYQQRVREKGLERRSFMERLQENQRTYELQLAELDHKIAMMKREAGIGDWGLGSPSERFASGDWGLGSPSERLASGDQGSGSPSERFASRDRGLEIGEAEEGSPETREIEQVQLLSSDELLRITQASQGKGKRSKLKYPPCPLCDRPLDERHWNLVLKHHLEEQQEIRNQLWVIREQLAVSDREIQVLRQEYRALEKELLKYGSVLERRGLLQAQLNSAADLQTRLEQIAVERIKIEQSLETGDHSQQLFDEMQQLDQTLQELNYDDKNHALARGEVDRWRWAEIKQAEIKQAQRRYAQLMERKPTLEAEVAALEAQLAAISHSPLQRKIDELDRQIAQIGYSVEQHSALRTAMRQAQGWQLRYQELFQAQQQFPKMQQRVQEMAVVLEERSHTAQTIATQMTALQHQLEQTPDRNEAIRQLEQQMQLHRAQLDEQLARLGRLQQQQQQLDALKQQLAQQQLQLQVLNRQCRIYQELGQAFGKNGIQALMIENVLPQLEAEANQILGRLSANQLHVQFVTQRAGRRRGANHPTKLIDTLDILIGDTKGTRPYETYSGGEAFRVNFAIRLALARLLAQRSGTALQMLIVDEGFGTQDEAGCDRLIGAINAIASDFACILTVTHMPRFKEAFQARIEVTKTPDGSQLALSV